MTIASALNALNTDIQNARTAITNKGGTVTSGGGSSQLATDIATISVGFNELPSYKVDNGVIKRQTYRLNKNIFNNINSIDNYGLNYAFKECSGLTGTLDLSSINSIGNYGLNYAFYNTKITSVDLSSLSTIGEYCLAYAFENCTSLTSVDLSSLSTMGRNGMEHAFRGCTKLVTITLSSLINVGIGGLGYAFQNCSKLTSADLSSVNTIDMSGFVRAFSGCTLLTDIYFNSLTTSSFGSSYKNQFKEMMSSTGSTTIHTIHFPSNLESTISSLNGYPLFDGTNGYVVCAFDLPATS